MSSIPPIVPNLPAATTSLTNKYAPNGQYAGPSAANLIQLLNSLPQPRAYRPATAQNTITPLTNFDITRARRGQPPLTARQSALALQTLATGQPATPPRRQGFFKSVLGDLRAMVGGIPHLPQALWHEAQSLPNLPGQISETLGDSSNPIESIGNLASLPGLRLVPGAYVAQQLAADSEHGGQGIEGLRAHPLFTALDILPVASAAAKTTKVAKTAKVAYGEQVEALVRDQIAWGRPADTTILPRQPRPLQTVLTRQLDDAGAVVPNRLGRGLRTLTEDITGSQTGSSLMATFKERTTSRLGAEGDQFLRETEHLNIPEQSLRPNVPGGREAMVPELEIVGVTKPFRQRLADEGISLGTPEGQEFYRSVSMSRTPDGTPMLPEQMLHLPPAQRVLARELRDLEGLNARYTDAIPGTDSTRSVMVDGVRETYDYRTAQTLNKYQAAERNAIETLEARQAAQATAEAPGPLSREVIQQRLDDLAERKASGGIAAPVAKELERLYTTALESISRPSIERIIPMLDTLRREYTPIVSLIDNLKAGRWSAANKGLRQLASTKYGRTLMADLADVRAEVSRLVERDKTLARTAHVTDRYAAKATRVREAKEVRAHSSRFDEILKADATARTTDRVRVEFATAADLDELIKLADGNIYDTISARDPRFERWVREDQQAVNRSWKELRDAGHDPIFLSRVTKEQAHRQAYARVTDKPMSLQAVKKRMMDSAPYIEDVSIIVNQQMLDIVARRASQGVADAIEHNLGRTRASLVEQYTPRLLANTTSQIPMKARLDDLIARGWKPYDRSQFGGKSSTFAVEGGDTIYIPRPAAENLRRMFEPPMPKLTAAFDPVMNFFRTSVLPLALRWQVNNAVGGAIVAAVEDPRAFLEMPNVIREMWGERKLMPAAADRMRPEGMPPPGIGSADPEMLRWSKELKPTSPLKERVQAVAQWASGKKAGELYNTARADRISKIGDFAKRKLEQSYGANQFVDDVNRASMGRAKMKKYLKEGYSPEAAQALAASSIRRVFQAWDEMTPMERSVMRSVVPFYGFAAYATRFVLHYPFDHPLRVSVLNSLTRAELSDALTGLPEYVRDMIFLGDPRANGIVKALNVSPFNPFGGVPSMFTVAGFLGQLNPVITAAMESIGVDVQRGGPQLYPEMRYDPETGRLVADPGGNFASNLIGNVSPQLSGVMSLLGFNDEFNETLNRDPAAAGRMLMGNFGLPVLYRDVNVGDQLIKTELARADDQETARKKALSTGNLGVLDDFPGLAAYGEQVRQLEAAGQLDQFRLPADEESGVSAAYALQAAL